MVTAATRITSAPMRVKTNMPRMNRTTPRVIQAWWVRAATANRLIKGPLPGRGVSGGDPLLPAPAPPLLHRDDRDDDHRGERRFQPRVTVQRGGAERRVHERQINQRSLQQQGGDPSGDPRVHLSNGGLSRVRRRASRGASKRHTRLDDGCARSQERGRSPLSTASRSPGWARSAVERFVRHADRRSPGGCRSWPAARPAEGCCTSWSGPPRARRPRCCRSHWPEH